MQLFMLLFAFASANLHHIIKYMKGSGPIGPSEVPFRCFEKKNQVIFGKISKGWIGTTGFSHGSDMLMLASFCNKYPRAKPVLSTDFVIVWVQLYSILTKDLERKKQNHYPELIQSKNCLDIEHEMLTKLTFL